MWQEELNLLALVEEGFVLLYSSWYPLQRL